MSKNINADSNNGKFAKAGRVRKFGKQTAASGMAVLIGGAALAACGSSSSSGPSAASVSGKGPVKIGVLVALTGGEAAYGVGYQHGIDLAISDINAAGGVLGHKLVPVVQDQGTATTATSAMDEISTTDHAPVVIGVNSGVIVPLVPVAERLRTVLIGPAAGTTALDGLGGKYVYRMIESDTGDANAISSYFLKVAKKPSVVSVVESGSETATPAAAFQQIYTGGGGTVQKVVSVVSGASSYATEVDQVLASGTKWVFLSSGVNTGSSFLKQLFSSGYKGDAMLYSSAVVPQLITATGASVANGHVYGDLAVATTSSAPYVKYAAEWQAKYHSTPAPYSQEAYAGMVTAALAMVAGKGVTGPVVNKNMKVVSGTTGVAVDSYAQGVKELDLGKKIHYVSPNGPVVFSAHGSALAKYGIYEANGGQFNLVYSVG